MILTLVQADGELVASAMGEAPVGGVYDPQGWLDADRRAGLEENFQQAFQKWELKVFVVILPENPAPGMDEFCHQLGQRWAGDDSWGMLFHVIDDPESPWCVAERGESLRWVAEDEFRKAVEGAMSRAHLESAPDLRVMVGVRELTDDLGFLRIVSKRRDQMPGQVGGQSDQPAVVVESGPWFLQPVWMVGIPLGVLLVGGVIMGLKSMKDRRFQGFVFPKTAPRRRFGGPWSGGGNVLVRFSDESKREDWD